MIKVDLTNIFPDLEKENKLEKELLKYQDQVSRHYKSLKQKAKNNEDFCGWLNSPLLYEDNEEWKKALKKMQKIAVQLHKEIEILVVCGIGGSYLGSKAAIDMINGLYPRNQKVKIVYLGNTLSASYTAQVLDYLKDKEFAINMISKSGTTLEPAIAFRLIKDLMVNMQKKDQQTIQKRIFVTTGDKTTLSKMAAVAKYETFIIPNDIGGRYSVLSPVGLFPMLVAGIDVEKVLIGAQKAYHEFNLSDKIITNEALKYAVARHYLYEQKNKSIEILATYELQLQMFIEWWKQLFGESEGKNNRALFPVGATFTTDLHSIGQFIQEGSKIFFETIIKIKDVPTKIVINTTKDNEDDLNYLSTFSLDQINSIALEGTLKAHSSYQQGNVPNIVLEWETLNSEMFGYATYFFMVACAISASLLEVNPFNQPGVEIYKKNMFTLLGKK